MQPLILLIFLLSAQILLLPKYIFFSCFVKFIYSEKSTNFFEISTVDLSYVVTVKSTVEISKPFVAFSEYRNFKVNFLPIWKFFSISRQKKKRSYGFATFKKKLIGKRRHCKGSDHNRCFREYFIDCPSDILKSLLGQFEALTLLKDLSVQADLARPPAQTLGQNLGELFESESCCDIVLVYGGHRIPAHKSILMAR